MNAAERWTLRLIAVGVVGLLVMQVSQRLEAREIGPFVDPRCGATQNGVSCTFTNQTGEASRSCVFGVVTNKADSSKSTMSQMICTGRLEGYETKTVAGEWLTSKPSEICSSNGPLGPQLDWGQCDFIVKH